VQRLQTFAFRVAVGGLVHVTNQFVAQPTTLEHFDAARGADVFTARMAVGVAASVG
jgi:hypothetical protein